MHPVLSDSGVSVILTGGGGSAMHLLLVNVQLSCRRELSVTGPAALPSMASSSDQLRVLQHVLHQPRRDTCR